MLKIFIKYRPLAFGIILITYLVSSFQNPLFEIIHFLSHLNDIHETSYSFHSFSLHDSSHEHITLISLQNIAEESQNEIPVQTKKDIKKKFEFQNYIPLIEKIDEALSKLIVDDLTFECKFFEEIPLPPPKLS